MAYPKISYIPAGLSHQVDLTFTYPPVMKPGQDDLVAVRHDSVTLSGKKQSWYQRTDTFKNLQMDYVPMADLTAWEAFMAFALTGGQFNYYPDASIMSFATYTLEDTSWVPKFGMRGIAKFTLRLRLVV